MLIKNFPNFIFASRERGGERRAFDFEQPSSTLTCETASGKAGSVSLSSGQLERLCVITLESEKVNPVAARPID